MKSETGYTPEDAGGLAETAPLRAPAFRAHLSTQKMYELKTKLRCACEGRPPGAAAGPAPVRVRGSQTPRPARPQTWWTGPSSAAAAGLTRSTQSACSAFRSRSSTTCSACP